MAMNIPMPGSFGTAALEGATGMQNILASMLQGRQRSQELAETAKYH